MSEQAKRILEHTKNFNFFRTHWDELCQRNQGKFVTIQRDERDKVTVKSFSSVRKMDDYVTSLGKNSSRAAYKSQSRMPAPGTPFPEPQTLVSGPQV